MRSLAVGALCLFAAGTVQAQGRCGESYEVRPGDTLHRIAQACRVPVSRIETLNPGVDPRNLQVGADLVLADDAQAPLQETGQTTPDHEVRAGDTLADIAARYGVSLAELMAENEDTDPFALAVGTMLNIPGFAEDPETGDPEDRPGADPRMTRVGRIRSGTECSLLVTPEGERYALTGRDMTFTTGDYVEVTGARAGMSFCMEGTGTIAVSDIRQVAPPASDRDPDRAGEVALDTAYLKGPWTAKGGTCARPDFDVTGNSAGGLTIETALQGAPRTGYVALGDRAAFIFDQPRRELAIAARGPDGLAVRPPDSGPVSLGGRTIKGDGRVFVKCP